MLSKQISEYLDWKCSYTKKAGVSYKLYLKRFNAESKKDFGDIGMQDITKYFIQTKTRQRSGLFEIFITSHNVGYAT